MSRGILYSLISRGLFILGAYIIHVYAGRKLGPVLYGALGVVLSILTISYIFLNNGVRQAVSKAIALYPHSAKRIFNNGLLTQFVLAATISLILSGFAGGLAGFFRAISGFLKSLNSPKVREIAGLAFVLNIQIFARM